MGNSERQIVDAVPVEVEVDVSPGALPKTVLVGLPEAAVKEMVEQAVSELSRRLETKLESEAARIRADLARHRRAGARPLAGFSALARAWIDEV